MFCELFGGKIQDLQYDGVKQARVFDIWKDGEFLSVDEINDCLIGDLKYVPIVWKGRWSMKELYRTVGKSLIPNTKHDREGVIITPVVEQRAKDGRRVKLKSITDQYITRHETNPDATEYT